MWEDEILKRSPNIFLLFTHSYFILCELRAASCDCGWDCVIWLQYVCAVYCVVYRFCVREKSQIVQQVYEQYICRNFIFLFSICFVCRVCGGLWLWPYGDLCAAERHSVSDVRLQRTNTKRASDSTRRLLNAAEILGSAIFAKQTSSTMYRTPVIVSICRGRKFFFRVFHEDFPPLWVVWVEKFVRRPFFYLFMLFAEKFIYFRNLFQFIELLKLIKLPTFARKSFQRWKWRIYRISLICARFLQEISDFMNFSRGFPDLLIFGQNLRPRFRQELPDTPR